MLVRAVSARASTASPAASVKAEPPALMARRAGAAAPGGAAQPGSEPSTSPAHWKYQVTLCWLAEGAGRSRGAPVITGACWSKLRCPRTRWLSAADVPCTRQAATMHSREAPRPVVVPDRARLEGEQLMVQKLVSNTSRTSRAMRNRDASFVTP